MSAAICETADFFEKWFRILILISRKFNEKRDGNKFIHHMLFAIVFSLMGRGGG
jgi:hypothetical protein